MFPAVKIIQTDYRLHNIYGIGAHSNQKVYHKEIIAFKNNNIMGQPRDHDNDRDNNGGRGSTREEEMKEKLLRKKLQKKRRNDMEQII